jgi:hypothetical protein
MTVAEAVGEFATLLNAAEFPSYRPSPSVAWPVFRAFAAAELPVACDSDVLLLEAGNFTSEDYEVFVNFVREFRTKELHSTGVFISHAQVRLDFNNEQSDCHQHPSTVIYSDS